MRDAPPEPGSPDPGSRASGLVARLAPHGALLLLLGIGLGLAAALTILAARVYDDVTDERGVAGLDEPILRFAIGLRTPVLDAVVTGFTMLAGGIGMPIIAALAATILAVTRRSWTPVVVIAAAGLGSLAMTVAGKDLVGRVRPPQADAVPPYEFSPSFPSGHTLNAVVVLGAIAYLLVVNQTRRSARVLTVVAASVLAILVGLSRVFLGHHWFTDVLAGWILGAAWLAFVITAHRLFLLLRARRAARRSAR